MKTYQKKYKTKKNQDYYGFEKEIVEKYEDSMRIRYLTVAYGIPRTIISTILKNKDIIKYVNVANGVTPIYK